MIKTFSLSQLKPNPFRHMDRYPIDRGRVEKLKESIKSTGFWSNMLARSVNGGAEIAYGHHRLVALKEELGAGAKVEIPVRDLTDEQMLSIMARENMEDWSTSALVEQETFRAVVLAYAEGKIKLGEVSESTKKSAICYAPSFIAGGSPATGHPYTAASVARFLGWIDPSGWPQDKAEATRKALELIERKVLAEREYKGMGTTEAAALTEETYRALNETKNEGTAKVVGREISKRLKARDKSAAATARDQRHEILRKKAKTKRIPDIDRFAARLQLEVEEAIAGKEFEEKMRALIRCKSDLPGRRRELLIRELQGLQERAGHWARQLLRVKEVE